MTNGTMKKLWRLSVALAAVTLPWISAQANAWCSGCGESGLIYHGSDFSFAAGIRNDYVTMSSWGRSEQGEVLFSRHLKYKDLNFYTVTAKMRYEFGERCCCAYTWANHFYIRGDVELGWLASGFSRDYNTNNFGVTSKIKSRQHKGRIAEGKAGFGWMGLICGPCLRMGPIVGWAYDMLRVSNTHSKISFNNLRPGNEFRFRQGDGDRFRNRWRGVFAGWDILYHACMWNFECGYEFHWMTLNSFYKRNCCRRDKHHRCPPRFCPDRRRCEGFLIPVENAPPGYFSQQIHSYNAYQNLVWARAIWNLHDDFTSGFGMIFKETRAKPGRIRPFKGGFEEVGEPEIFEYRLSKMVWRSFEFQIELGYHW